MSSFTKPANGRNITYIIIAQDVSLPDLPNPSADSHHLYRCSQTSRNLRVLSSLTTHLYRLYSQVAADSVSQGSLNLRAV